MIQRFCRSLLQSVFSNQRVLSLTRSSRNPKNIHYFLLLDIPTLPARGVSSTTLLIAQSTQFLTFGLSCPGMWLGQLKPGEAIPRSRQPWSLTSTFWGYEIWRWTENTNRRRNAWCIFYFYILISPKINEFELMVTKRQTYPKWSTNIQQWNKPTCYNIP